MNLKITGIIIRREYLNRVKKKSFLVTTFVVPVLMAALCIVPIVLMTKSKEKAKTIAVVDASGIVVPTLENTETITFVDMSTNSVEELKSLLSDADFNAVLSISELTDDKSVVAEITSSKPLGLEMTENIDSKINKAVEAYRIDSYNIAGLDKIMQDVKSNIHVKAFTMDDEGKEKISEAGINSVLSMALGLILFMFITLFGSMVMSAVIEEKTSRVVEVLVSSVKATELMFGKIIGIALVALTQFLLWIVLTGAIVGGATAVIGQEAAESIVSEMPGDVPAGVNVPSFAAGMPEEVTEVLGTIQGINFGQIIGMFLIFFVFGYLLYASLFAAIGSAVENEGDTQQLQLPITIPLMIGYFIAIYAFNAPDSTVAFWGSMIPFTSPIVMLARIPFGVDTWELVVSVAALILATAAMVWLSAKIYKVGILMFGKKSTWKDLWNWLKQK